VTADLRLRRYEPTDGDRVLTLEREARVDPDHHRRGFGEAVLVELEAAAERLGYGELVLETTARQRAAQGLYEKHGYERTDASEHDRFEVLTYRKSLDGASR